MTAAASPRASKVHREVHYLLELIGVYAIAVAQPVLAIFGDSPDVFVQLRASRWVIVAYTLIVLFVPPVALWAVERLTEHVNTTARRVLHIGLISLGVGVFALQLVADSVDAPWIVAVSAGAIAAVCTAVAYSRYTAVSAWAAYLSPAALVFGGIFLLASPVADLVLPHSAAAAEIQPSGPDVPVVLVVFDELPTLSLLDADGAMDEALFPSFAELAHDATWYRNATTVHGFTWLSVPSIQTGRLPPTGTRAPTAAAYPKSVYTLLGGSYTVNDLQEFALCPASMCPAEGAPGTTGMLRSLLRISSDTFVDRLSPDGGTEDVVAADNVQRDAADLIGIEGQFDEFVDRIVGGRTLSSAHVLLPHHPWLLSPSGTVTNSELERDDPLTIGGWDEPEFASVARQHHLLQTMAADRMLGDMVDHMREIGVYDEALIVVTADHGISFDDGEVRRLSTESSISEIAWVPLFVKYPGQGTGDIVDDNVMVIDILPTIADVVGIDIPWDVDGISLVSDQRSTPDKEFVPYSIDPENYYPFGGRIDGKTGLDTLLERSRTRFVNTIDPRARPFARGDFGELVGRPLEDFELVHPTAAGRLESDRPDDGESEFAVAEEDGPVILPVWVWGSVHEDLATDPQLAFVVDGTIVATTGTFDADGGERRFETLLPEDTVASGPLSIFLIEETRDGVELRPVPLEG